MTRPQRWAVWCVLIGFTSVGCAPAAKLTVDLRDGRAWLTDTRPFSQMYCYDLDDAAKPIWVAICNHPQQPCTQSVPYGDIAVLNAATGPAPLVPGRCYACNAVRSVGNGETVTFRFDESGTIEQCWSH
jgi:hypothetical protein